MQKEGRKKQARLNEQGKATQHTQGSHLHVQNSLYNAFNIIYTNDAIQLCDTVIITGKSVSTQLALALALALPSIAIYIIIHGLLADFHHLQYLPQSV